MTSRRVAGLLAVGYMLVQGFQELAYRHLGAAATPVEELLQGPDPWNLWRAALLLVWFFPLLYVFVVVCQANVRHRPALTVAAFLGLAIFCFLEIGLRSVELFHVFLELPAEYARAPSAALDGLATFQAVQRALYFPLMLGQGIGSALLALGFEPSPRNRLVRFAFGLNALRLAARLAGMFLHVGAFDVLSGGLYLPLVVATYGPLSIWLLRR